MLNVSPDGLFMRVDEPPPVDEIVRVTIEAPSGGIAVDGRVQWVAPLHMTPRPGFGVQILEAPETYTDFVYATRITDHGYGVMRHPGLHAAKRASTD